jgi:hypothetical protein
LAFRKTESASGRSAIAGLVLPLELGQYSLGTRTAWCCVFQLEFGPFSVLIKKKLPKYCTALHCTALHCTALHCTALHCGPKP